MHDKEKPLKTSSSVFRKHRNGIAVKGHLFLGHKLLDELRILMRLSSAINREHCRGLSDGQEQAY